MFEYECIANTCAPLSNRLFLTYKSKILLFFPLYKALLVQSVMFEAVNWVTKLLEIDRLSLDVWKELTVV